MCSVTAHSRLLIRSSRLISGLQRFQQPRSSKRGVHRRETAKETKNEQKNRTERKYVERKKIREESIVYRVAESVRLPLPRRDSSSSFHRVCRLSLSLDETDREREREWFRVETTGDASRVRSRRHPVHVYTGGACQYHDTSKVLEMELLEQRASKAGRPLNRTEVSLSSYTDTARDAISIRSFLCFSFFFFFFGCRL